MFSKFLVYSFFKIVSITFIKATICCITIFKRIKLKFQFCNFTFCVTFYIIIDNVIILIVFLSITFHFIPYCEDYL